MADTWIPVGKLFANPARQTNSVHVFIARDLNHVGMQNFDETEDIG